MAAPLLGLQFESTAKFLELIQKSPTFQVVNYGITQIPAPAITSYTTDIQNPSLVSALLENTFNKLNLTNRNVAIALPGSMVMVKKIQVAKTLSPHEIETQAWFEASKTFPELIGNLALDYTITGVTGDNNQQWEVLLVVCRKEHVDIRKRILEDANLIPTLIDVEYYALGRTLEFIIAQKNIDKSQTVALLNLAASISTLVIVQNENLIYSYDQAFQGQQVIDQCKNILAINDFFVPFSEPTTEMRTNIEILIKENILPYVRHFLQFFYTNHPTTEINQLYIAGDCALIPNLCQHIQESTNLPTLLANPFEHMSLSPNLDVQHFNHIHPCLAICAGLALSQVPS